MVEQEQASLDASPRGRNIAVGICACRRGSHCRLFGLGCLLELRGDVAFPSANVSKHHGKRIHDKTTGVQPRGVVRAQRVRIGDCGVQPPSGTGHKCQVVWILTIESNGAHSNSWSQLSAQDGGEASILAMVEEDHTSRSNSANNSDIRYYSYYCSGSWRMPE